MFNQCSINGLTLVHRLRCWTNVNIILIQRLVSLCFHKNKKYIPFENRNCSKMYELPQQTRLIDPILDQCWTNVVDGGPTLVQHWIDVSCLLGPYWDDRYYNAVADPRSEKRGAPGILGVCPQDFLVNFSQFRGLFEVFGEHRGGGGACCPPPPWIRHCNV